MNNPTSALSVITTAAVVAMVALAATDYLSLVLPRSEWECVVFDLGDKQQGIKPNCSQYARKKGLSQ